MNIQGHVEPSLRSGVVQFALDALADWVGYPARFGPYLRRAASRLPTIASGVDTTDAEVWLSWGHQAPRPQGYVQLWSGSPVEMFGAQDRFVPELCTVVGSTPLMRQATFDSLSVSGLDKTYHLFVVDARDAYDLVEPMRMWGGILGIYPAPSFFGLDAVVLLLPRAHRRTDLAARFWKRNRLPDLAYLLQSSVRAQRAAQARVIDQLRMERRDA